MVLKEIVSYKHKKKHMHAQDSNLYHPDLQSNAYPLQQVRPFLANIFENIL